MQSAASRIATCAAGAKIFDFYTHFTDVFFLLKWMNFSSLSPKIEKYRWKNIAKNMAKCQVSVKNRVKWDSWLISFNM